MKLLEVQTSGYLEKMANRDQKERQEYQEFVKNDMDGDWGRGSKVYAEKKGRESNDIFGEKQTHEKFIHNAQKFNFGNFTKNDWKNFWIIVQHMDTNREFQQKALTKIEKHLGKNSREYKYLYDRISCGLHGKQKYSTQDICEKD